jgi:hypothetical protein
MARIPKWPLILTILFLTGCRESVRIAEHGTVRIANDSEGVRKLIFDERDQQISERRGRTEEEWKAIIKAENFQGREAPRRLDLLNRFASAPGFDVPNAEDAEVLETTNCGCTLKEQYSNAMVKIRINSGPFASRVGWVCDDRIRRVRMWP